MSNPSRKQIARTLREQGNVEAALAVMLDYKPTAGAAVDDDEGAAPPADPTAPQTLTQAEMKAMTMDQAERLQSTPEGVKLLNDSLQAAATAAGKAF